MKTSVRVLVLLSVVKFGYLEFMGLNTEENERRCEELAKEPYFDMDILTRNTWRVYYTWFIMTDVKCLDLTFKNATPEKVSRIHDDMHDYLETQPNWEAATILLTVGSEKHEMLLLADQGPAGSFVGLPNVIRDSAIKTPRKSIKLLKFFMKLFNNGEFLVLTECDTGLLKLLAAKPPKTKDILELASRLSEKKGKVACNLISKQTEYDEDDIEKREEKDEDKEKEGNEEDDEHERDQDKEHDTEKHEEKEEEKEEEIEEDKVKEHDEHGGKEKQKEEKRDEEKEVEEKDEDET